MRRPAKKSIAIFSAAVLAIAGTGVAFAYWTSSGSGEGTAATGDAVTNLTIVQTSTVTDLRPGGAAQPLTGNFTNAAGNGPVYVTTVTASIGDITQAGGAVGACTADDYTLASAVMDVGVQVPEGTGVGAWSGATIAFNNSATVNQDGCQGATVQILYESN